MTPLALLYLLSSMLVAFVGFRNAAGRNGLIFKRQYYVRCVVRAFMLGQVFLICLTGLGLALVGFDDVARLEPAAWRAVYVYVPYTITVLLTFIPYAIPNWEVRSLATVAVFGPLTLLQPVVVTAGCIAAIQPFDDLPTIIFFTACTVVALGFERLLARLGWAQRDAEAALHGEL